MTLLVSTAVEYAGRWPCTITQGVTLRLVLFRSCTTKILLFLVFFLLFFYFMFFVFSSAPFFLRFISYLVLCLFPAPQSIQNHSFRLILPALYKIMKRDEGCLPYVLPKRGRCYQYHISSLWRAHWKSPQGRYHAIIAAQAYQHLEFQGNHHADTVARTYQALQSSGR